jgi:hypothetical protein
MERSGGELRVRAVTQSAQSLCLTSGPLPAKACDAAPAKMRTITLALPAVELVVPAHLPEPGERTRQLKALAANWAERSASFSFEGQAGEVYDLPLRLNRAGITVKGAGISGNKLRLPFPSGEGYIKKTITFEW